MAAEITKLAHYHEGRVSDSLVEVFHKMDIMLADDRYSQVTLQMNEPMLHSITDRPARPL